MLKMSPVGLTDTEYMICNTPTVPSRPIIHALQLLATCMPKYHKSILQRVKLDIFVCIKFVSPSESECDSNAPIFNPIGHELTELHEFYKMHVEMEIFCLKQLSHHSHPIPDEIWKFLFPQEGMYKHYLHKYFLDFRIIIACLTVFVKNMNL